MDYALLAEKVVQALIDRQKKALVLYTGSLIGFKRGLAAMEKLRGEGFTFKVFMSLGASQVLDQNAIRGALRPFEMLVADPQVAPEAMVAPFDTVIVPALTIATAARVANCMMDTPVSRVMMNSLMKGRNVIITNDGCCPDNADRLALGYTHITPALREKLRGHLRALQSYGAVVTTTAKLAETALATVANVSFAPSAPKAPAPSAGKPAAPAPAGQARFEGHVLTRGALARLAPGTRLLLAADALVSPSAADEARRLAITLTKEGR